MLIQAFCNIDDLLGTVLIVYVTYLYESLKYVNFVIYRFHQLLK